MRVRIQDSLGDYTFGQSLQNFYIDQPETVAQIVTTTLKLFQGEWYLNTQSGVPYFESVIGKHSKLLADFTVQSAITNVQGVVTLIDFESNIDADTRQYSVTNGTLNTIYGQTELQLQNVGTF